MLILSCPDDSQPAGSEKNQCRAFIQAQIVPDAGGLDPAMTIEKALPCHMIGIAGSSPATTGGGSTSSKHALTGLPTISYAGDISRARTYMCEMRDPKALP